MTLIDASNIIIIFKLGMLFAMDSVPESVVHLFSRRQKWT
jgi:hypothetical protein